MPNSVVEGDFKTTKANRPMKAGHLYGSLSISSWHILQYYIHIMSSNHPRGFFLETTDPSLSIMV